MWCADSFDGLPPPDEERYPADKGATSQTRDGAWHGRPTLACTNSFMPDQSRLEELERRLPEREALRGIRRLGFTTLVLRPGGSRDRRRELDAGLAAAADPLVVSLLTQGPYSAWRLLPEPAAAEGD